MREKKLTKEQWIQKAYEHLVKRLCEPEHPPTEQEQKNLRDWADALWDDGYGGGFGIDGYDPVDAVEEDFSYA